MTTRLQLPGTSGRDLCQQAADQQHEYCLTHPLNTTTTPYRAERYADVLAVLDPDTETETGEWRTVADRVPTVPQQGEQIVEGMVYQGEGLLFIGAQNATMTEHDPSDVPALLTVWRPEGEDVLTWVEGERVAQGAYRRCPLNGEVYVQIQPGEVLTVAGQEPSAAGMTAVWGVVSEEEVEEGGEEDGYPAWEPWDGTNESLYHTGDRVSHKDRNWESQIDDNHWEPGEVGENIWKDLGAV